MKDLIIVRGGGDLATGTIYKLYKCGFPILILEVAMPSAIRRNVAFSEAVYQGTQTVEDVTCYRAESLVEAALYQAQLLEEFGFRDIKVSLKASGVASTVAACRIFAERTDYPLHLGVTEAGTAFRGTVKSAVGIGSLLLEGIGNTIRVSLSAPVVEEVRAAKAILESCGLREAAPEIVSCPTCGRTSYDLMKAVNNVEKLVDSIKAKGGRISLRKIAVMGCEVNGPGEAADADIGIAGGNRKGSLILFKKGERFALLPEEEAYALLEKTILESVIK
jgi:(E)-4-hydroxy-3-methylbut-2-enyl-diphosphate synthase